MRYREFGGKKASAIALGSTDFGGSIEKGVAMEYIDAYYRMGGNFMDTARVYGISGGGEQGNSEKVFGCWMEENRCRDKIFLSTKGGHPDPQTMHISRLSRDEIMGDMKRSLDNLRTDKVDIYWLHRDDEKRPVADILETLTEIAENGYAGMVGVSNWTPARIMEANAYAKAHGLHPLDANQVHFSLAKKMIVDDPTMQQLEGDGYRMHAETGMPLVAFSSQAKGFFLKLFAGQAENLSAKARSRYYHPENLATYERVLEVRRQTGLSVGAIALAWLMDQPFPVYPIIGVSKMAHIDALKEMGDASLTPAQRDYLRKM